MSDIITRLREGRTDGTDLRWTVGPIHLEAAAEIERLRAALRKLASGERKHGDANDELLRRLIMARAALKEPK